jgi:phage gp36-like protein
MSTYLHRDDIEARIPPAHILEALDDDSDAIEDEGLWDKISATIQGEIDGHLSRRYTIPLSDPPASLRAGAATLACELLYQRRGIPAEANPYAKAAAEFRAWLTDLATGKAALTAASTPARPPISIITEAAGTVPAARLNG